MNGPPTWCDLWVLAEADVDIVAARLDALTHLAPEELERLERLVRAASRRRHLGARILSRWALSRYLDATPAELSFGRGAHGRPVLLDSPRPLDFNLTHTEGIIACAITPGGPIGVDAEPWPARHSALHIVDQVLTEREQRRLAGASTDRQAGLLAEHWVLKEAYTKALGLGLHRSFTSFEIRATATAPTVHDPHTAPAAHPDWSLQLLRCGAGHVMALAAPTTGDPDESVCLNVIDAARVLAGLDGASGALLPTVADLAGLVDLAHPATAQRRTPTGSHVMSGAGQSRSRHP